MADHGNTNNKHTRRIAEFVSGLTYEKIPAEVRERIKLLILDSLGCAIYGADLEWCRILRGTLENLDATRTTSIWGTGAKLSSDHAALVNGTAAHAFELDDYHNAKLHPGAVVVSAALAKAEHLNSTGTELVTAIAAPNDCIVGTNHDRNSLDSSPLQGQLRATEGYDQPNRD